MKLLRELYFGLNESAQDDVQRLETQIGTIDAQIEQRTAPLRRQKEQLEKQLVQRREALAREVEQQRKQAPQQQQAPSAPIGNAGGTPGGASI